MPALVPGSASTFTKVKITVSSSSAIFSSNLRCDGRVSHFSLHPNVPLLQDLHKVLAMIDGAPSLDSVEALRSSHDEKCPDLDWLDWPPLTPLILTEQRREMMDQPSHQPQSREEDAELHLEYFLCFIKFKYFSYLIIIIEFISHFWILWKCICLMEFVWRWKFERSLWPANIRIRD